MLWSECLSGALYWNDFLRLAKRCGFADPRLVTSAPVVVGNAALEEAIAQHMPASSGKDGQPVPQFYSATYRLWKIPELEPDCEDYGQAVQYLGTIPYPECQQPSAQPIRALPLNNLQKAQASASSSSATTTAPAAGTTPSRKFMSAYTLDDHHIFPAGKVMPVCGNTLRMLRQTRLKEHFRFYGGDFTQHYGIFDGCGKSMPFSNSGSSSACNSSGCC